MKKMVVVLIATLVCLAPFASAQVGAKKAGDSRVEKILKEADLKYTVDGDGDFRLGYNVGDGRTQLIWILSNTSELETLEIRQIWSIAYRSKTPFSAGVANRLLEQNAKVKLGSWQVRKMGDDYVAVFSAQIAADTDRLSLLLALHAVTTTADEIEKELTGKDNY